MFVEIEKEEKIYGSLLYFKIRGAEQETLYTVFVADCSLRYAKWPFHLTYFLRQFISGYCDKVKNIHKEV